MRCKICNSTSEIFGKTLVLKKYNISFFFCNNCGFIQTEEPYWLDESYSSTITKSDIGLISRNISMAEKTRKLIVTCFDPNKNFVDYGGGYGMFTRLMRDKGFDFYQYDPYCKNIFAEDFKAEPGKKYSLVTAWEVFEHLVNPLEDIKKMLEFSHFLFFSTILLPPQPKPLGEWWYYGLEHGQHIAFYSPKTIVKISEKYNLSLLYSDGSVHLMGDAAINPLRLKICFNEHYRLFRKLFKKIQPDSLIEKDFKKISGIELN